MGSRAVEAGAVAPDATVEGEHGELVALSDLWAEAERGIVLSFLRHYG